MTEAEAFTFGFLSRCADEALSPEEIADRVDQAHTFFGQLKTANVGGAMMGAGGLMSAAPALGALSLLPAFALGTAGGYGLGKLRQTDVDPDDLKTQELIAAYQQQTDQIRRAVAQAAYRSATQPRRPRPRVTA